MRPKEFKLRQIKVDVIHLQEIKAQGYLLKCHPFIRTENGFFFYHLGSLNLFIFRQYIWYLQVAKEKNLTNTDLQIFKLFIIISIKENMLVIIFQL